MARKSSQTEETKQKRETFTRSLRCVLKTEEIAARADKAGHLMAKAEEAKEELAEETKQRKSQIKRMGQDSRALMREVTERATMRDVECERVYDYKSATVSEVRKDTGEPLAEPRAMTDEEKQRELPYELPPSGGDLDEEFE